MRFKLLVVGVLATVLGIGGYMYVQRASYTDDITLPQFSNHPAEGVYRGRSAEVDFSSYPPAEVFRTAILSGVSEGANFAGHYTVVMWGCGTSCQSSAIVDTETGRIVVYGIVSAFGVLFQPDSTLFVVNPREHVPSALLAEMKEYPGEHYPLGSVPTASDYYVFENDTLTFFGRYGMKSGEEYACEEVVSPARNPFTEETRDFPTPCSIPFGWEALETAEGV